MTIEERILAEMEDCEPYTAQDLADLLDENRRTVDRRLRELAKSGDIQRKKHNSQRVSWWIDRE